MKHSWIQQTDRWLGTYGPVLQAHQLPQNPEQEMQPHQAASLVRSHVWRRILGVSGGRSSQLYLEQDLGSSNGYINAGARFPQHAVGMHWLTRARTGAIWTGRDFARIGWLSDEFRTECLFCHEGYEGETLVHLLVECPRWAAQRVVLQPLVDEAQARLGLAADSGNLAVYLLGGRTRGDHGVDEAWCEHWVNSPCDPQMGDAAGAAGAADGVNVAEDDRVPGFVLVARFFEAVMPTRLAELSPRLNPPRADAPLGMAALQQEGNHLVVGVPD